MRIHRVSHREILEDLSVYASGTMRRRFARLLQAFLGSIALLASPAVGQDIVDASISFEAITISASEMDSSVELELPTKTFLPSGNNI